MGHVGQEGAFGLGGFSDFLVGSFQVGCIALEVLVQSGQFLVGFKKIRIRSPEFQIPVEKASGLFF